MVAILSKTRSLTSKKYVPEQGKYVFYQKDINCFGCTIPFSL